mmetsp:Transcript_27215/g.70077  ORF Transcript_27215/g.70077 Transcript_27215/m.70077 type:complete len:210 (-) Transcript_27215:4998-5627(-)
MLRPLSPVPIIWPEPSNPACQYGKRSALDGLCPDSKPPDCIAAAAALLCSIVSLLGDSQRTLGRAANHARTCARSCEHADTISVLCSTTSCAPHAVATRWSAPSQSSAAACAGENSAAPSRSCCCCCCCYCCCCRPSVRPYACRFHRLFSPHTPATLQRSLQGHLRYGVVHPETGGGLIHLRQLQRPQAAGGTCAPARLTQSPLGNPGW